MSDINNTQLALSVTEIALTQGLPALVSFVMKLSETANNKEVPTVEEILAVKGKLDTAKYFPGLKKK